MSTHNLDVQDGVAVVTLDRPRARNSLNAEALTELTRTLRHLDVDESVDVVVLTGTDPAFCAGLDLRELAADPDRLMSVATDPESNPWRALREMRAPVIGAVNGPAVTGGLEMALACDFLVASEAARFADTHARVGVLPAQGMPTLLSAAVGTPMAKYLSLTGSLIDAEEALRIGLVVQVVPHQVLLNVAISVARVVQDGHRGAVRKVKESYEHGLLGDRRAWLTWESEQAAAWCFDPGVRARAEETQRAGSASLAAGAADPLARPLSSERAGRVTGFFHVSVTTSNLEASLDFYRDGLGLEVVARNASSSSAPTIWGLDPAGAQIVMLRVPGSEVVLELFEFHGIEQHPASSRPCDFASSHFCLYVDDAAAVYARMTALGHQSRSGRVVTIEDGPLSGARAVYLKDPDGYHVEVLERPTS